MNTHRQHERPFHNATTHTKHARKESSKAADYGVHNCCPAVPLNVSVDILVIVLLLQLEPTNEVRPREHANDEYPAEHQKVCYPERRRAALDSQGTGEGPAALHEVDEKDHYEHGHEDHDVHHGRLPLLLHDLPQLVVHLVVVLLQADVLGPLLVAAPLPALAVQEVVARLHLVLVMRDAGQLTLLRAVLPDAHLLPHVPALRRVHLERLLEGVVRGEGQECDEHHHEERLGEDLVQERPDERPRDGQGLHHEYQIPVDEGTFGEGMALPRVEVGVGEGSAEHGDVRQRNGVLGGESHDEDIDGHENAPSPYASPRRDHEPDRRAEEPDEVVPPQGAEGLVFLVEGELLGPVAEGPSHPRDDGTAAAASAGRTVGIVRRRNIAERRMVPSRFPLRRRRPLDPAILVRRRCGYPRRGTYGGDGQDRPGNHERMEGRIDDGGGDFFSAVPRRFFRFRRRARHGVVAVAGQLVGG
mmetsp:Transcript_47320/g.143293  ORF Transcript_47320/g.143293 Transcript_47320/m.143293 type:complete len:472 (-) Transcript_47320:192-1607(-)